MNNKMDSANNTDPDYLHDKTLDYCSGLLSRGCPISMCSLQVYAEEVASRHVRRTD